VNYVFKTTPAFRKALARLNPEQKRSAKAAFKIFRENPFDPRLRAHKIHKLSALYGKTIHSVSVEGDLRSVFYLDGNMVVSVDIGTHAIYRA
jgi:mRNA-degrading endonuclease YafQ of YafQ-DinJ toxin-antitoxin module